MENKFDELFGALENALSDDPNADLYEASDIRMLSYVPHGIPTRQPMFDLCIGRNGVPVGRIMEFFGFERTGKTTAAYHIIGECQRRGGIALFIDSEQSFDLNRAIECGCVGDQSLRVASVASIDAVFRTIDKFMTTLEEANFQQDVVIVVDSVTGVENEFNLQNEFGTTARPGEDARTIRSGCRRIMPRIAKLKIALIFINHAIETMQSWGKKAEAAGGHGIKFYSGLRAQFTHMGDIKDTKSSTKSGQKSRSGQKIKITVEKLKGSHLKRTWFTSNLLNEGGFDCIDQLFDACIEVGILKRLNNTNYALVNLETKEELETITRAIWPKWVEDKGGFEKVYSWWFDNAQALGEMIPWGHVKDE